MNITNDHISEPGVLEVLLLTRLRKPLNLVPPKNQASEFAASQMAHVGEEAEFDLHVRGALSGT